MKLLARRGLDVTMDDVARAAGIGRRTLFRYFATREELLVATMERTYARIVEGAYEPRAGDERHPDELLRRIMGFAHREGAAAGLALWQIASDPQVRGELRKPALARRRFRRGYVDAYGAEPLGDSRRRRSGATWVVDAFGLLESLHASYCMRLDFGLRLPRDHGTDGTDDGRRPRRRGRGVEDGRQTEAMMMDAGSLKATVAELMPGCAMTSRGLCASRPSRFRDSLPSPSHDAARAVVELLARAGVRGRAAARDPGRLSGRLRRDRRAARPADRSCSTPTTTCSRPGLPTRGRSPPFEPEVRGGRMYGRGAADDKSGVVSHACAIRAFGGRPPVGVKVIVEGEEETDSHLEEYVRQHPDLFRADAIIVADAGNLRPGVPTLTTALRGVISCTVEVRTLAGPVHSGQFGGPAPDALMALVRMLATLQDDGGNVAVAGLASGAWPVGAELPEERFRQRSGSSMASTSSATGRSPTGYGRGLRSTSSASMRRPSRARRTRSCRWREPA